MILVIVVRHLLFHFHWVQAVLYSNCKLKTFVYFHRYTTFSSEKQRTVMWQALQLSHHQNRPGNIRICRNLWTKAVRRRFFGTSFKSREQIEKFQRKRLSKQLLYISIRAFSKIRILSWETGYLASVSTTSSPLQTKPLIILKVSINQGSSQNFMTVRLHLWK